MDENDKNKAVAIGAALFLFAAAFGFAVAAMQYDADTGDELTDAESRIRDTDMAREMLSEDDMLPQAAQSMLAQANQAPENVLQLLRDQ